MASAYQAAGAADNVYCHLCPDDASCNHPLILALLLAWLCLLIWLRLGLSCIGCSDSSNDSCISGRLCASLLGSLDDVIC